MPKFLHNIDLNGNELQNAVIQVSPSAPAVAQGKIYFDSTDDCLKVYSGTLWMPLGKVFTQSTDTIASGDWISFGDESETEDPNNKLTVNNFFGTGLQHVTEAAVVDGDYFLFLDGGISGTAKKEAVHDLATLFAGAGMTATSSVMNVIGGTGISADDNEIVITPAQTTITSIYHEDLKIGHSASDAYISFDDNNEINFAIDGSEELVLNADAFYPATDDELDLGMSSRGFDNMFINGAIQPVYNNVNGETGHMLQIKGGGQAGGGSSVNDPGGLLRLYGGAGTGTGAGGDIQFWVAKGDAAASPGTVQNDWAVALTIDEDKKAAFAGEVTIAGDLTVTGTTTTVDTVTMEAANAIVFEGATTDSTTTTLTIVDPLSNQTIYLPDAGGYIPLIADASTTDGAVTATEFALLDGGSSVGTDALASGDGFLHNDGGVMKHTSIATLSGYMGDAIGYSKSFVLNHSVDGVVANNAGSDSNIFTITHGFTATFLVKVEILEIGSSYATVYTNITRPTNASVVVTFATTVANGAYVALLTRVG